MFVWRKGKRGVILIPVESFIRTESAPGGLMWSHSATTNTEWIQCCNQTYFLPLKLPAQTALFYLEIHPPQYSAIFVMIVQLQLHMRNFTQYGFCHFFFFILVPLSPFKSDIFFSVSLWRKNHLTFISSSQPWCNPALPQSLPGSRCLFLFVFFFFFL